MKELRLERKASDTISIWLLRVNKLFPAFLLAKPGDVDIIFFTVANLASLKEVFEPLWNEGFQYQRTFTAVMEPTIVRTRFKYETLLGLQERRLAKSENVFMFTRKDFIPMQDKLIRSQKVRDVFFSSYESLLSHIKRHVAPIFDTEIEFDVHLPEIIRVNSVNKNGVQAKEL